MLPSSVSCEALVFLMSTDSSTPSPALRTRVCDGPPFSTPFCGCTAPLTGLNQPLGTSPLTMSRNTPTSRHRMSSWPGAGTATRNARIVSSCT